MLSEGWCSRLTKCFPLTISCRSVGNKTLPLVPLHAPTIQPELKIYWNIQRKRCATGCAWIASFGETGDIVTTTQLSSRIVLFSLCTIVMKKLNSGSWKGWRLGRCSRKHNATGGKNIQNIISAFASLDIAIYLIHLIHLIFWSFDLLIFWSFDLLIFWSFDHLHS